MRMKYFIICLVTVLLSALSVQAQNGLILWNKLGSTIEVQNSEVGPDLTIVGNPSYDNCKYGQGVHTPINESDHLRCDSSFLPKNQGCIEFWWKPSFNWNVSNNNYNSTFILIHDSDPSGVTPGTVEMWIAYNAKLSRFVCQYTSAEPDGSATHNLFLNNIIPTPFYAGDIIHLALVWDDQNSIEGQYSLAVYQDGIRIAESTQQIYPQAIWPADLLIAGVGTPGSAAWEGCKGPMDNIKIYSCPKTDFSDRFDESALYTCPSPGPEPKKPEPPTRLHATAGRDVVNIEWKLSTSRDVATYRIYRSLTAGFKISAHTLLDEIAGDEHVYHDRNVDEDIVYYYRVTAVSSEELESDPTDEAWARPGTKQHNLLLLNNKINPQKGDKVKVKFTVETEAKVNLKIYNIKGTLVYEYPDLYLPAGEYEKEWDGINKDTKNAVSSGVYTVQLFLDDELVDTKKVIIVK